MTTGVLVIGFVSLIDVTFGISTHPLVLVVAIDGFGFEYLERGLTPTIQQLKENGCSAKYMYNAFPTVTNPNFFSLSTGLHPETHGVIGNRAFDENFKCLWRCEDGYELFHYNANVTPLWTHNELNGKNRYSATLGWPSSEFVYRNHKIAHNHLNEKEDSKARVDQAIKWFLDDERPANLMFLYFEELDDAGHLYGPNSANLNQTLREVDQVIEYLVESLVKNGLRNKVNLILLSDHGMLELEREKLIDFRQWLRNDSYEACGGSPNWQIKIKPGFEEEVYENLTKAATDLCTFNVYRRTEIPERWHVKRIDRQADLLLVAKPHFGFYDASEHRGEHGYDPDADIKIRPIFIANGPAFKSNYVVEPFSNVDIFPLVSKILNLEEPLIKPNGTITFIKDMLRNN